MIYLTNINLNQNELQNAILQPLAVAPSNPKLGQIYTDSTSNKIKWYNGTKWTTVGVLVESSTSNGKIKVDGVEMTVYELPAATQSILGGVKIDGSGLEMDENDVLKKRTQFLEVTANDGETDIEALSRAITEKSLNVYEGDIGIVHHTVSEGKTSTTAYMWLGGNQDWAALDGNVSAKNVLLSADIVTAGNYTQVGNITKGSNTATGSISAKGKTIEEVFQAIFTKEQNPTATKPSVSITLTGAGAKEVGTTFTPSYSATFNPGSYTYGPATGLSASSWAVTDTNSGSATTATGTFDAFTVEDSTNYKVTAVASYGDGAVPVTNLGNAYAAAQIKAGTASKTSNAVTGYRSYFYGSKVTPIELTSGNIRGLTNSGKAVGSSQTFSLTVVEGTKQVVIAFPANTGKSLSKVLDVGAFGTDIVASFTESTVAVEGVAGYTAINYKVYVYSPDAALGANTYTVTIS